MGCDSAAHQQKLAEDQRAFHAALDAQKAQLDQKLEDAIVRGMLLDGSMSEHSSVVFEECREAQSKTPTCLKLQARVLAWEKKHAGDNDKQLKADGVKP